MAQYEVKVNCLATSVDAAPNHRRQRNLEVTLSFTDEDDFLREMEDHIEAQKFIQQIGLNSAVNALFSEFGPDSDLWPSLESAGDRLTLETVQGEVSAIEDGIDNIDKVIKEISATDRQSVDDAVERIAAFIDTIRDRINELKP